MPADLPKPPPPWLMVAWFAPKEVVWLMDALDSKLPSWLMAAAAPWPLWLTVAVAKVKSVLVPLVAGTWLMVALCELPDWVLEAVLGLVSCVIAALLLLPVVLIVALPAKL